MNPYTKKTVSGFTLVELLIVVIILAILAAIVVPQFASSTDDAKDSALDSTLANMRAAIDLYYQQHKNTYPGALAASGATTCDGTKGTGGANTETAFLDQLAYYSDASGNTCTKKTAADNTTVLFPYGPYLKKHAMPKNPITQVSTVSVATGGDLNMSADGANLGWKFDTTTGKFIANDSTNGYDTH